MPGREPTDSFGWSKPPTRDDDGTVDDDEMAEEQFYDAVEHLPDSEEEDTLDGKENRWEWGWSLLAKALGQGGAGVGEEKEKEELKGKEKP